MMLELSPKISAAFALMTILASLSSRPAEAASRLDAETIQAGLRTADDDEVTYIRFVVALVDQGRLSRPLVESTFQWARRQPVLQKRFQYFKSALITLAARDGVRLPQGTPDLTPTITGRVVKRVFTVDVPARDITVTLRGTKRSVVTDANGNFRFTKVSLGRQTLDAKGLFALIPRKGSAQVLLPAGLPFGDTAFVEIRL
ncbi:MAG TPA: hypothetical protein VE890_18335 [Thermoguttaceae bacterium]|nr:hypothetical protein [Thermoguttaceae bacterium]